MPQRAVGFDEINSVIIPSGTNENLRNLLNESGVNAVEYEADNEEARLEKLNSPESAKFSTMRESSNIESGLSVDNRAETNYNSSINRVYKQEIFSSNVSKLLAVP